MWLIRVVTNYLQHILPALFVIMILSAAYGYMSNEDYNDSFSVTFTFSCKTVLTYPNDYPPSVVEECNKMRAQLNK
jgi:hypothetical protein